MQNEPTLPLRCWDSKFLALPGSGAQPRGFGPGQVFPYMPMVSLVRSPSCRRTSPGLRPRDDDLECEPSPAPPISSSFPFSPPVPVGRMFHRHLPHQCPRDARPICGAWIAGGPWAGWSTSSTAEVTVGLASPPARPQLLPLSLSLSPPLTGHCSSLPRGLPTQIHWPNFSHLLHLGGGGRQVQGLLGGWGEAGDNSELCQHQRVIGASWGQGAWELGA